MTCSKFPKVTIRNFQLKSILFKIIVSQLILITKTFAVIIDFYITETNDLYISMQQINLYEIPEIA